MSIKKGDNRSVRHTKKRIRDGLLALMRQKPIQNISVKELTDYIDLNRGTFYFHYRDIYDLLEQLEAELLEQLQTVLSTHHESSLITVEELFVFLQENADLCSILLGPGGDMAFVQSTKQAISKTLIKIWQSSEPDVPKEDYDFFNAYIINGFTGLVQLWYETGMSRSPHEMAIFAGKIMTGFLENK